MPHDHRYREWINATLSHSSRSSVTKIVKPEIRNASFLARADEPVLDIGYRHSRLRIRKQKSELRVAQSVFSSRSSVLVIGTSRSLSVFVFVT